MSAFFICSGCAERVPDEETTTHWCKHRYDCAREPLAERVVVEAMRNYRGENRPTPLEDACRALAEFEKKHGART